MIHVGDNTWNLRIFITDLQVEKTLRVRGDLHIGGVMLRLVDPGEFYTFTERQPKKKKEQTNRACNLASIRTLCIFAIACGIFVAAQLHLVHARYSSNPNGINIKAAHDFQFAELV